MKYFERFFVDVFNWKSVLCKLFGGFQQAEIISTSKFDDQTTNLGNETL